MGLFAPIAASVEFVLDIAYQAGITFMSSIALAVRLEAASACF
jgi:hypothetical protein